MENFTFLSGGFFRSVIQSNIFRNWQRKVYLVLASFLLLLLCSGSVNAAVESFIARCDEEVYYQYCYEELLESYALDIIGKPNGLYEDFKEKKSVALNTIGNDFIDYQDILDQYALSLSNGEKFDLKQYAASENARKADLPSDIKMVSLASGALPMGDGDSGSNKNEDTGEEQAADSDQESVDKETATPIVASAKVTLDDATSWAKSLHAHQRFIDIAPLYWEYGEKSGIRPEVLYAQAAYESGFGRFGGQVPSDFNNWAGIKVGNSNGDEPEDHQKFDTPEDGVRAHFNHMSAYVGLEPIGEPHDRYHSVASRSWAGIVEKVEELSGKWAPSSTYHERIVEMIGEMK